MTNVCTPKNTVSMCFTRPSPRRLPTAIPALASIDTWALNFHPQSGRILCRSRVCDAALTKIEYSASPELSGITACPLQYVLTVLLPYINAQPEPLFLVSDATSVVCVGPGLDSCDTFLPLEQPNQSRTHSEQWGPISSNPFRPGSMAVATCAPSLHTRLVSKERYCARIVFAR